MCSSNGRYKYQKLRNLSAHNVAQYSVNGLEFFSPAWKRKVYNVFDRSLVIGQYKYIEVVIKVRRSK